MPVVGFLWGLLSLIGQQEITLMTIVVALPEHLDIYPSLARMYVWEAQGNVCGSH